MTALPTWSHCIPTLDRIDMLEQAVRLSLGQTCPAKEIIIVDASERVDRHRARIEAVVAAHPGPKPDLHYLSSPDRSLTRQRNQAIARATGDILFLFDDDTLMFPDCAEEFLKAFAADRSDQIAAAMAFNSPDLPREITADEGERKASGASPVLKAKLRDLPVIAWIWNNILMMSAPSHFVAFDTPRRILRPDMIRVGHLTHLRLPLLSGFAMAVRAPVARKEPFDESLLSYSPAEDLDASYRFSRHGLNILVETARVHHFEAAAGRIKRKQTITLGLMNLATFVAKNSASPARDIPSYYLRYLRRLLAEFLKDGLSRRFTFPQLRGALAAFWPSVTIFSHGRTGFDDWYRGQQMRVLGWPTTSLHPAAAPTASSSPLQNKG